MRTAIIAALVFAVGPAWAGTDLSGKWALPHGGKAKISQQASGKAAIVARLKVDGRKVKLVLKGQVHYAKLGGEGGLSLNATASPLRIRWNGKRCVVKQPKVAVLGDLVGGEGEREYRAKGSLHGHVYCGGENTWKTWVIDLTGTWK